MPELARNKSMFIDLRKAPSPEDEGVSGVEIAEWFENRIREEVLPAVDRILSAWRGSIPEQMMASAVPANELSKKVMVMCSQCVLEGYDPPESFDRYAAPMGPLLSFPT